MILKEFRIVIPMSVAEYQIGQLYSIQKKSRLESLGAGKSGVEILENKPYEKNNQTGQYTLKVYHVDERLPAALKTVAKLLFPKSALFFEEESWNSYPHTRTKFSHKLFKSFSIDIESQYLADYGQSENVFNLSSDDLSSRSVDHIDIVNDPINPNEYKLEEDPAKFHSTKTNRGPLSKTWLKELKEKAKSGKSPATSYMCVYKLCRIECPFWGCQSRVEKLICESVLRNMIFILHRQAWCWQDEYIEMTIDEVRKLELETQQYLGAMMRNEPVSSLQFNSSLDWERSSTNMSSRHDEEASDLIKKTDSDASLVAKESVEINEAKPSDVSNDNGGHKVQAYDLPTTDSLNETSNSNLTNCSSLNTTLADNLYVASEFAQSSTNFEEFFDAISQRSFNSSFQDETLSLTSVNSNLEKNVKVPNETLVSFHIDSTPSSPALPKANNNTQNNTNDQAFNTSESKLSLPTQNDVTVKTTSTSTTATAMTSTPKQRLSQTLSQDNSKTTKAKNSQELPSIFMRSTSMTSKTPSTNQQQQQQAQSQQTCTINTLIFVVHGGNVTCADTSAMSDFANFKLTMETIIRNNYQSMYDRITFRLVKCDSICKDALQKLSSLSPIANQRACESDDSEDMAETSTAIFDLHENFPFNLLPLLALANKNHYRSCLAKFTRECNQVYQEFINSKEGKYFQGQIVMIGDSLGSLLVYDSLCQANSSNLERSSNANSVSSSAVNLNNNNFIFGDQLSAAHNLLGSTSSQVEFSISEASELDTIVNDASRGSTKNNTLNDDSQDNQTNNKSYLGSNNNSSFKSMKSRLSTSPNLSTHLELSVAGEEKLDFDVTNFFALGSPLATVLLSRQIANKTVDIPCCSQVYNLFHLSDPCATRIEPLLCKKFSLIEPCMIPRYSKFPHGDGTNISLEKHDNYLDHFIVKYEHVFETNIYDSASSNRQHRNKNQVEQQSEFNLNENYSQLRKLHKMIKIKNQWWGENRIDYVLYAPEQLANFPRKSLPYIFHSCFWESTDVVSFIMRVVNKSETRQIITSETSLLQKNKEPAEKWQRRLNRVKLKNLSPNHRANDVIVLEDREQQLTAKFSYGPLDFVLAGEKVDIYIMSKSANEIKYYSTEQTDSHGRLKYTIPKPSRLSLGVYQIKMVVKCDQTFVEFYMTVLPPNTEIAVFSIDGSFAANISFTGNDPKVRAGAVDVVRYWQDLGYLILYITARPDIQHYKVTNWLAQHNFPLGMIFFSDGLSTDPIKQKTETLRSLIENNDLKLHVAYGSAKDIPMYSSLGVANNKIFIIGKMKNKYQKQAVVLKEGYAAHLSLIQNPSPDSRQACGNARLFLKKDSFNIRHNPYSSINISSINATNSNNNSISM